MSEDRLSLADRFGLDEKEAALADRRFRARREFGLRGRSSFEDFVGGYAAGLRSAADYSKSQAGLFLRETPDAWRRVLDQLGVPREAMYWIVAAFRARTNMGSRDRASFSDFAGAFVAGAKDGGNTAFNAAGPPGDPALELPPAPPETRDLWQKLLPENYVVWNDAIARLAFNTASEGRPVYLAVDTDFLERVASSEGWRPDSAETEFLRAVRPLISPGAKRYASPISFPMAEAKRTEILPFIGVLALTALAASKMVGDQVFASNNFYGRMNQLIGKPVDSSKGFEQVVDAWSALGYWLDQTYRGQLGHSTARALGRLNRVGYPISQALLREHDRRILPAFFRWAALSPGDEIGSEDLSPLLLEWVGIPSCQLSDYGCRYIRDAESRPYVADIVSRELELWSGELEVAEGTHHRTARAWLGIGFEGGTRVKLYAIPQRPRGFPETLTANLPRVGQVGLSAVGEESDWFVPLELARIPLAREEWGTGNAGFAFVFELLPVNVCVPDEELGLYRQVPCVTLNEVALVLASPEWVGRVRTLLKSGARPGFRESSLTGLPSDWVAFAGVQIAKPIHVEEAELRCLAASARVGVNLTGGLRLGPSVWLTLGEPTLHVRMAGMQRVPVYLDGEAVTTLPPVGGTVDLREFDLPSGRHEVKAGEKVLAFITRDGTDPPGPVGGWRPITVPLRREGEALNFAPDTMSDHAEPGPAGIIRIRGATVIGLPEAAP